MRHAGAGTWLAATMLVAVCAATAAAQPEQAAQPLTPIWLPRAEYPQLAQSARIQGEVEIAVLVRPDGSVASTRVARAQAPASSTPQAIALLEVPALDAAQEASFASRPQTAGITSYSLTYAFVLDGADELAASRRPQIGPHASRLTTEVKTGPMVCILWSEFSVRGPKCLYLWQCDRESAALRANGFARMRDRRCLWLWNCGWDVPEPKAIGEAVGS